MSNRTATGSGADPVIFAEPHLPLVRWWYIAVCATLLLAVGCHGFWICEGRPRGFAAATDILYRALQLFVFEYGDGCDRPGWTLQVARFLSPLLPAGAIVMTLLRTFRHQMASSRLRRLRHHVVICGLGRKGTQLVRDYRTGGTAVVAIDLDGNSENARRCRALGAFVLAGNAIDAGLLERARVPHASRLVAISGDDGVNVEVALVAHALIEAKSVRPPNRLEAFVHVIDPKLCGLFREHHVFANQDDQLCVHVFNAPERQAQALLRDHPLDADRVGPSDRRPVHLICVGFGKTGEAVLVAAARQAPRDGGGRLRATIVDLQAAAKARVFRGRYPELTSVCEAEFIESHAGADDVLDRVIAIAAAGDAMASLFVTMDDDSANLLYALQVRARVPARQLPICVRLADVSGLAALTAAAATGPGAADRIFPFGMPDRIRACDMLDGA